MIKNGVPTLAMKFEDDKIPGATAVQVSADSRNVVVAYLNQLGNAIDVRTFSVQRDPELAHIVKFTYFDDVWDIEMVLSLIEPVDAEQRAPEMLPLALAYLQSLQVAS